MSRVLLVASLGLLACVTTPPPEPPEVPVAPDPPPTTAVAPASPLSILQGDWFATEPGSDWYASYSFADDGHYTAGGHPAYEESGRIELLDANDNALRLRFRDRIFDGSEDDPIERELILSADHSSFVLDGHTYDRRDRALRVPGDP